MTGTLAAVGAGLAVIGAGVSDVSVDQQWRR